MSAHLTKGQSIRIPLHAKNPRSGYPEFRIPTEHGPIDVEFGRGNSLFCRGTPEAIVAFGLIEPEWLPGIPGNNATAQAVYIDDSGALLLFGKNRRGKRPTSPRIIVRAWGFVRRTVDVQIPLSQEQAAQYAALQDEVAPNCETAVRPARPAYHADGNVIYLPGVRHQ